ncbi:sarcosine oxidase subunit delta [Pokkaliibacter sp. CJK22405]|uniref:sarcosine oxidase subunit delta n=1 Tax=Pokkaliibacter sp. CJK22405 TaxID=3384615 RepID=UPI0039854BE5
MLTIYCPYCKEVRDQEEFTPKGQAHISRPLDPMNCTDEEWGNYVYFRKNIKGVQQEMWVHTHGCRKYFNVTRDTVTYQIHETYPMGEQPKVAASEQLVLTKGEAK